jgi:transposase
MMKSLSHKTGRTKPNESEREIKVRELTDRQRRAIPAMLEGKTIEAAAKIAGVSKTTLYEWMKQKPFHARLEEARADLFKEGMDIIKAASGKAARRLIELLDARNENTRRLTAREILALSLKISETQEIEKRLERLEEILEARTPRA